MQLVQQVHKRLHTTVEEDTSNREHYQEVREREERAAAEREQLEHKLKLQRVERQKQVGGVDGGALFGVGAACRGRGCPGVMDPQLVGVFRTSCSDQ